MVDEVLARRGLPPDTIVRKHAATFGDLSACVAETEYSIFQFSGHGTSSGIYLEAGSGHSGELITAERIASLLSKSQPRLKAAIFMCCFSADAIPQLLSAAPHLITVFGGANDDAAIEFSRIFYENYLHDGSVPKACFFASFSVDETLQVVLSRRAANSSQNSGLLEIRPYGIEPGFGSSFPDSFLVDISEAEADIAQLEISREVFLGTLSRKIRLHGRIFDYPRERAVLPVGPYAGIFSWQNATDVIHCHRILRLLPDLEQDACDTWAGLAVSYNQDATRAYRHQLHPSAPYNRPTLTRALDTYRRTFEWITDTQWPTPEILLKYVPDQYKLTRSLMKANLESAERKIHSEDYAAAVFHLESALSAEHDLFDALTQKLTVS